MPYHKMHLKQDYFRKEFLYAMFIGHVTYMHYFKLAKFYYCKKLVVQKSMRKVVQNSKDGST
jgi:hypothetical protein